MRSPRRGLRAGTERASPKRAGPQPAQRPVILANRETVAWQVRRPEAMAQFVRVQGTVGSRAALGRAAWGIEPWLPPVPALDMAAAAPSRTALNPPRWK